MPDLEQQLEEAASPLERMKLIAESAECLCRTDINRAAQLLDEGLPFARKLQRRGESRKEYAMLLQANGWRQSIQGNLIKAEKAFREALPLAERHGSPTMVAYLTNALGSISYARSEYSTALQLFEKASSMMLEEEDPAGIILSMNSIGSAYKGLGRLTEALDQHRKAAKMSEESDDPLGLSNALSGIGICERELGNLPASLDAHLRCLQIKEELHEESGLAKALTEVGNHYWYVGNDGSAIEYLNRALAIAEKTGNSKVVAADLINLGGIYAHKGDFDRAIDSLERGTELANALGDKSFYSNGLGLMSGVAMRQGDLKHAIALGTKCWEVKIEIGDKRGQCYASTALAQALAASGDHANAILSLREAVELATELKAKPALANAAKFLSDSFRAVGNHSEAFDWLDRSRVINEEILRAEAEGKLKNLKAQLEREQAEKREALLKIENDRIERELDLKTKHLATMAMSIVKHSNFLNAIGKGIGEAAKKAPKTRKQPLDQLARLVKQQSQSENEWKLFEQHLDNLSPEVIAKLATRFPQFTPTELKICALMKIGLGCKETASLLCISVRSVETYRSNIRKKLKLKVNENLMVFLSKT